MAITKGAGTSVIASTNANTNSSVQNVSANYLTEVYVDLIQNGTATTAATVQIQPSPDNSTFYNPASLLWTAPLNAGTYDAVIQVPGTAIAYKAIYTIQNGGTNSVCAIQSNFVNGV